MGAVDKSFDTAGATSKLLTSLSTGAIGFGLAVINVERQKPTFLMPASRCDKIAFAITLFAFVMSAAFGIWTQLAITEILANAGSTAANVWDKRITFPFRLQIIAILFGLALFVAYGVFKLASA